MKFIKRNTNKRMTGGGVLLNKKGIIPAFAVILTILTILISIGYAALNTNLNVSGEAFIRAKDNVRISRVDLSDAANDGYETYNPEYSKRTTKIYATLPKDNSSITYTVKATNSTGVKYKVDSIEVDNTNPNVSCTPNIEVDSILEDGITEFTITANYKNGMSQDTNLDACEIKYEFSPLDKTPPVLSIQLVKDNGNTKTIKITATDEVDGSGLSPDNVYKYYLSTSSTEPVGGQWKEYTNDVGFEISGNLEVKYLWIYPVKDIAGNINDGKADINTAYVAKTYMFIDNSPTLYNVIAKEALTDGVAKLYTGQHNDAYDESGTKKVFHFYGADDSKGTEVLTKNNVIFGGFCWQMIRTTDTGGTKLIYNGVPKEQDGKKVCTNSGSAVTIGNSAFASAYDSPAYAGYMYNTVYQDKSKSMTSSDVYKYAKSFTYSNGTYKLSSDAISIDVTNSTEKANLNNAHYTCFNTTGECETIYNINYIDSNNLMYYIELQNGKSVEDALNEMLYADDVNKTNSAIKNVIDTWYANNMTNYTKYLEDTVFCNDRTIADYGGWDSNGGNVSLGVIIFTNGHEYENKYIINTDIYCSNMTDRFSVENSKAKLTYPVGMISVNEMYLLGNDNARKSGARQWVMSPGEFNYTYIGYIRHRVLDDVGDNDWSAQSTRSFGVRPSVSLAANTMYVSGAGSTTDPYIVDFTAPTVTQETLIGGEREKTVRITVSDDYGLSSENKYKYYLSTSETELVGGEWKDYASGEIFTITGENETRYLWIYPVMDNAGNINDDKTNVNTPYMLIPLKFKDKLYLYNVLQKEYASGSGLSKLYEGQHSDSYNETGTENIYHFYGADDTAATSVLNKNNVLFAGFCWQMIRTTDTGGTKLIYNGVPKEVDGKKVCTNSGVEQQIGTSAFNTNSDSPAYVGYMYNAIYSYKNKSISSLDVYKYSKSFTYSNGIYMLSSDATSIDISDMSELNYNSEMLKNAHYTCFNTTGNCNTIYYIFYLGGPSIYYIELNNGASIEEALQEMFDINNVNQKNSTIKDTVDTWYANNMTNYTKYLEDTVFCNDRSISDYGGWNPNGGSVSDYLKFKNNNYSTGDLYCANITDRFSVGNEKAKLTYKVGLTSTPEMYLLGNDGMRKTGELYWSVSPSDLYNANSFNRNITNNGTFYTHFVFGNTLGVRPAVSLAPGTPYVAGTGSKTDPYVIGLKLSATTLTDDGNKKTVKITVNVSSDLSSENKYQYYLSTSNTTLTGGEWKDYTLGEEFTLTGTNGTRYLWIYPIKDNSGNISDGRDNISEPYYISSYKFVSTYTVAYVGNKFSTTAKVQNGVTVTYDQDTSILTLNGNPTNNGVNFMLLNQTFNENDQFKITLDYISGTMTSSGSNVIATEISNSNKETVSTRNYADTYLRASGSSTNVLVVTNIGANEGAYLNCWLYISSPDTTTFSNYQVKINVTKVDTSEVKYNQAYGILGDTPTRYGNTFAGWYTEEFSGTQVTSETIMTKESDHSIYAHWTPNNYTVTINPNGGTYNGSTSNTTMTIQYGKTQTIANPTRAGYIFAGWSVSGENSNMNGTTFTMGGDNATLTANWTSQIPTYTYTGSSQLIDDGNGNWRIKFLTSGTLTFTSYGNATNGIDVFLVGGGGGGSSRGAGAGGGYTLTVKGILIKPNLSNEIIVGKGGAYQSAGNESSALGYKAAGGGAGGGSANGANGGSGGGAKGPNNDYGPDGGRGGSNGGNGKEAEDGSYDGGCGQIKCPGPNGETGNTREFGENTGDLYAAGGGGGAAKDNRWGENGTVTTLANSGAAGRGYSAGQDGIVIIRNHR